MSLGFKRLSLVHTYADLTRTKPGNVRTLSPYCAQLFFFWRTGGLFSAGLNEKQQTKSAGLDAFAYSPRTLLFPSMCH